MNQEENNVEYAELNDDIIVIRVQGRGTFNNSMALEKLDKLYQNENRDVRYIFDLEQCSYMDSTFMGVLALLGNKQMRRGMGKVSVMNLNQHTLKLLSTLGLNQILDCHQDTGGQDLPEDEFQAAQVPETDKYNQIVHILEAHRGLADLDPNNKLRFENVLTYLEKSLAKEEEKRT
ncbi:STAS domain-containing protein [Candidatus Sumerlaeota bacterium]|nr:STAS domain-containing protein [Candidatus Sumerlaeota bacterium]